MRADYSLNAPHSWKKGPGTFPCFLEVSTVLLVQNKERYYDTCTTRILGGF